MIQKLRQLSENKQNQIAENVIQQIKEREKHKTSNYVSKLSDDLLMPILDSFEDDLFVRDRDTGREISL
jgi:predicted neuraminidase